MAGVYVEIPEVCEVCGVVTGPHYDVHRALIHPELVPAIVAMRAHRAEMDAGKKGRKKKGR